MSFLIDSAGRKYLATAAMLERPGLSAVADEAPKGARVSALGRTRTKALPVEVEDAVVVPATGEDDALADWDK